MHLQQTFYKKNIPKIIYWICALIVCFIFIGSSISYILNYSEEVAYYKKASIPIFLVIPTGLAKFFGGLFILFPKISAILTKLSYFIFILIIVLVNMANIEQGIALDVPHTIAFFCILVLFFFRKEALKKVN